MTDLRAQAIQRFKDAFPDLTEAADVTIEDLRRRDDDLWNSFVPADIIVEPVDADGVASLWVSVTESRDDRAVIWYHGGGYVIGSAQGRRAIAASIARAARCRVLVPDYRLAPEHKFPAAVDDALAVYRWTSNRIGPDRLILGGDSAGAGLALATLLALRDQRLPRPAGGVAMSPLADWTLSSESHRTLRERDPFVTAEMLTRLRPDYLGSHDPRDPLASPVFGDYADLPPLLVLVGTEETLLDDAFSVARAAARGGGGVDLRVFQSMFHIWPMFASILPEGNDAIGLVADFVTKHVS